MRGILKKGMALLLTGAMGMAMAVSATAAEDRDMKVGVVISSLSDAIFAELVQAMQKSADEEGVKLVVKECPEVNDKITGIENFVSAGCDVIICHVTDTEALKDAALAAEDAGVHFFSYDSDIEGTSAFVGVQNYDYGYAIGENAAKWVNENFEEDEEVKVAVCNYPDYGFLIEREEGILAALEELAPNTEVVATAKAGYTPEGIEVGDAWVQSCPDVNVVVGINDAGVLGVYEVFNAADITGDKLGMFGGDATADAISAMEAGGTFRGTVSTSLVDFAPKFIEMSIELCETGTLKTREEYFPVTEVTMDNLEEFK